MAIQSFDQPPAASGILEHGNHVLKITKAVIAYGNRGAQLEIEVTSVSPHSAGQTLRNQKFLLSHSVFTALGFAARFPPVDTDDADAVCAAALGRIFACECKPQDSNPKFRQLGWPKRPTDAELASVVAIPTAAPPVKASPGAYEPDDEIPF